jgi:transposase
MSTSTLAETIEFVLDTSKSLPSEPPKRVTALILWQVILHLVALLQQIKAEIIDLQAELRLHRVKRFGKSSEKQTENSTPTEKSQASETPPMPTASQKEESMEAVEETPSPSDAAETDKQMETSVETTSPVERKRGAQPGHSGSGRHIPTNLPSIPKDIELPEAEQHCSQCGQPYRETSLTEDSSEVDIQVHVRVIRYRRKRYERQCNCAGSRLITAPVPPKLIPKGKFSIPSWVKFLLDKYYAQVPLTRQIASLQFLGLPVCKGTLIGGFKRIKTVLDPLYEYFLAHLRTARRLHADETRWRVFAEVDGKTGDRWWLWVFLSDEVVGYVLDPFRSTAAARKALSIPISKEEAITLSQLPSTDDTPDPVIFWFDGKPYLLSPNLSIISADRYIVYTLIDGRIQVAFCWVHVRRDFVDFQRAHADQPELAAWADTWIKDIAHLYQLNDARLAVRSQPTLFAQAQAKLQAALEKFESKCNELDGLTLKQQKILISLKKHWTGLTLFVANPDIPMDNNVSERLLRDPACGRKIYYGSRAQWAGELAAMLFTIIQTCLLNDINPYAFLVYYFEECARLESAPTDLISFAPWVLKKNNSPDLRLSLPQPSLSSPSQLAA